MSYLGALGKRLPMHNFTSLAKPADDEYSPSGLIYAGLLPEKIHLLEHLYNNIALVKTALSRCSEEQLLYRYNPDKWTVKEMLLHLIDDERIYAYRALCFSRNEKGALPGFDQDGYASQSGANQRTGESLLEEFETVRMATISLFNNLREEALSRSGFADGSRVSVRALGFHIAAHELHHFKILKEKYCIDCSGNDGLS
jgi:hypothetical protein